MSQMLDRMSQADRFLTSGYADDDVIAIAFRKLPDNRWCHRFLRARDARSSRFLAWLRHLNATGHDLYVSMNSFTPGVRSRTEANVAAIRHVYVEFDDGGTTALEAVKARSDLPQPSSVVHSSPGKFQVVWNVDGFTRESAKSLLRHLAYSLGADRAVHDINRVLRLPGFAYLNYKYRPPAWVSLEAGESTAPYRPDQFPAPAIGNGLASMSRKPATGCGLPQGKLSQSERDWRFVCNALRTGTTWRRCVEHLIATRPDKANPHAYAVLTVRKALLATNLDVPSELATEDETARLGGTPHRQRSG